MVSDSFFVHYDTEIYYDNLQLSLKLSVLRILFKLVVYSLIYSVLITFFYFMIISIYINTAKRSTISFLNTLSFKYSLKRYKSTNNSKQIIFSPFRSEVLSDHLAETISGRSQSFENLKRSSRDYSRNILAGGVKKINQSSKTKSNLFIPSFKPGILNGLTPSTDSGNARVYSKFSNDSSTVRLDNRTEIMGDRSIPFVRSRSRSSVADGKSSGDSIGIRFVLSGRLNGVRMARKFRHRTAAGKIKSQTFLDPASRGSGYTHKNVYTKWGVLGLRIWTRGFSTLENIRLSSSRNLCHQIFQSRFITISRSLRELKKYNPVTPSLRHRLILSRDHLDTGTRSGSLSKKLYKRQLIKGLNKNSGRNNQGRITSFRKGGGHKKSYRKIDFLKEKNLYGVAEVLNIEYNPHSNNNIALLKSIPVNPLDPQRLANLERSSDIDITSGISSASSPDKSLLPLKNKQEYFYILAPQNLKVGEQIKGIYHDQIVEFFPRVVGEISELANSSVGELKYLKDIPVGSFIHSVELSPGSGGKLARAAGTYCVLLKTLNNDITLIKLPSNKIIELNCYCKANIGQVSNPSFRSIVLGKAGASRWLGIRPKTRGEAMNAVDHPHGGKNHGPGGLRNQPKNRWGKLAKWQKTSTSVQRARLR